MSITFISFYGALVWFLSAMLALVLYRKYVRPRLLQNQEFLYYREFAGTRIDRIRKWLVARWDLAASAIIMGLPSAWNGLLDLIIAISLFLADSLPALSGLDLSAFLLPTWVETTVRVGGALLPVIRANFFDKADE